VREGNLVFALNFRKEFQEDEAKMGSNWMMGKALGEILVERKVLSRAKLDLALERQKQEKGKYLGQILFEMGVPQDEINKALDYFNKRKPLGQILIDLEIINPQQLEEALERQKQVKGKTGRIPLGILLVQMGYISYDGYLKALSKHFNMPIVPLEKFFASPALQKLVGEKYARRHLIVVLENTPQVIKLAMAEPNLSIMEELQRGLPAGKRMEFYLANPYEIESCLKMKFNPYSMTQYA